MALAIVEESVENLGRLSDDPTKFDESQFEKIYKELSLPEAAITKENVIQII